MRRLKDYQLIANALRPFYQLYSTPSKTLEDNAVIIDIITTLSKALSKDNPKFNPVKFLDYIRNN